MNTCTLCKHFSFSCGTGSWGDETPGSPPEMLCAKSHWEFNFEPHYSSEADYLACLTSAEDCADFEKSEFVVQLEAGK